MNTHFLVMSIDRSVNKRYLIGALRGDTLVVSRVQVSYPDEELTQLDAKTKWITAEQASAAESARRERRSDLPATKNCAKCKEEKPATAFSPGKRGRPQSRCKVCRNQQMKEWNALLSLQSSPDHSAEDSQ